MTVIPVQKAGLKGQSKSSISSLLASNVSNRPDSFQGQCPYTLLNLEVEKTGDEADMQDTDSASRNDESAEMMRSPRVSWLRT